MSFHHRQNQRPVFIGETGAATATPPVTDPTEAQKGVSDATNKDIAGYKGIFDQQMTDQAALYAAITALNQKKNEQSSYLSLAKSVSEMV